MSEVTSQDQRVVLRGRPAAPVGLNHGDDVIRLKGCPDCDGRGYFLIQPFVSGGSNGAGGLRNMCQCQTCADSQAYCMAYGELPPSVVADMAQRSGAAQGSSGTAKGWKRAA